MWACTRQKKSVWQDLPQEVDQIWAEAYTYWLLGESLYMTKEEEQLAEEMQESHREASGKEGVIREFVAAQTILRRKPASSKGNGIGRKR